MSRLKAYALIAGSLAITFLIATQFSDTFLPYIENGEILTLEARFTPEQIMERHRGEILGEHRSFQGAQLSFYPYVLMDVKYPLADNSTREGVILWSMVDGEMVLNTDNWETTHGFEDALNAKASDKDFKIMTALAKNRGTLTVAQLQKALKVDPDKLGTWIQSARDKHLVIQRGDEVRLHFENPRILVSPHTKMTEWLVTKPYGEAKRMARRYTRGQIEKTAHAAFGQDFTIRNTREVFLPVYTMETANPDGSVLTSYWNALNGRRILRNSQG